MDCENRRISFLRPKDPSLTDEYLTFESIRINLAQAKNQEGFAKNQAPGCMQIYLRIKKSDEQSDELYEADERTITCSAPGDQFARKYKFSRIFKADSTQADLFNIIVKPKLFEFINGKSSSLFAYGASGSGKTFTIVGSVERPGIIPRTLEYLFTSLPDIVDNIAFKPDVTDDIIFLNPASQKEQRRIREQLLHASQSTISAHHVHEYKAMQQRLSTEPSATVEDQEELFLGIWVSFAEIYNESVYDLLKPHASKKKPREKLAVKMSDTRPYLKGLTVVNVSSSLEAYQILQYGLHNLKYASTCVNAHSSRSHSIFTIKLIQGSMKTKEYIISYFNFCDLAGSERLKRTLNTGERLKESNSINTSLLVLGKCIRSILSSQKSRDNKPVPYRESKLTHLFQRALRGLEDMAMIVNMNPDKEVFEETLHALNFSAIAREIEVTKVAKIVRQMEGGSSEDDGEIAQLKDVVSERYVELEAREADQQDEMIRSRSELVNEYKTAAASASKEYEKEKKRIEQYYERLLEEKVELLTKKYELMSRRTNENAIIVLDSSEDEDFTECNKGNEECVNCGNDVVIVLDSSEDEEDPKECNEESDLQVKSSLIEARNHGDNHKSDVFASDSFEGEEDFKERDGQSWKDFESESTDGDDSSLNTAKTTDERLSVSVKTLPKITVDEYGDDAYSLTESRSESIDKLMCGSSADWSSNMLIRVKSKLLEARTEISKEECDYLKESKSESTDDDDFSLITAKTTDERLSVSVKTQPKINVDEYGDDAYSLTESRSESIDKLMCESNADWSSNVLIDEKSKLLEARTEISDEECDHLKESESESIGKSKTESDCDFSLNNTFSIDEKSSLLAKSRGDYSLETVEAQLKTNENQCGDVYLRESKSKSASILEAQTEICENECDELKLQSIDDPTNNTIEKSMTSSVDESVIDLSLRIEEQTMIRESSLFEQHDSNENYDHVAENRCTSIAEVQRKLINKLESESIISELFGEESQFVETLPFPKLRCLLLSEESNSEESRSLKMQHEDDAVFF